MSPLRLNAELFNRFSGIAEGFGMNVQELLVIAAGAVVGYVDSHTGSLHMPLDLTKRWHREGWSPVATGFSNPEQMRKAVCTVDGLRDVFADLRGYVQYVTAAAPLRVLAAVLAHYEDYTGYGHETDAAFGAFVTLEYREGLKNS